MKKFSDDGRVLYGAYGPRIHEQLGYVLRVLANDPTSRQAVMTIWRNNPPASKDIPCTLSVQFLIRNNKLYCFDTMRSSDLWLGWPYDVFSFSMLSLYIVLLLREGRGMKLKLGELWITAGSQHIYDRDREGVLRCSASAAGLLEETHPYFTADRFTSSLHLINFLKNCADGKESLTHTA
jgi:thymidylate synthase